MTRRKDPFKYKGSGKYWKDHCRKHGWKYVQTLEIYGFDDPVLCSDFAENFSRINNIIESKEWANLKLENGSDGNPIGYKWSEEAKEKASISAKGKSKSEDTKIKMRAYQRNMPDLHKRNISLGLMGHIVTEKTKQKQSLWQKGKNYEEKYGKEKSDKIKEKIGHRTRGKTYEEIYGVEKARILKELRSKSNQKRKGNKSITNGVKNKNIYPGDTIPEGWRYGRVRVNT